MSAARSWLPCSTVPRSAARQGPPDAIQSAVAARECTTTADCSGGFECTHYVCTPIDPIVCDAGTATCSGGNTAVLRCNADGTMEMSETCAMGSRCVVDGMAASCAPVVCTADEVGCTSDFTAFACDSTGTVRTETPCATGFYCGAGVCAAQACTPGATRCSAAGVHEVCDARGAVFEAAPCADTQGCRDGACLDRICTPAAARCVPGSLTGHEVCDAEGLAYVSSPCAATESCSAGACLARTCAPSVASCDGTTGSHVCNADGLGYSATMSCGAGASCSVATGLCGGWLCTPGTTSCLASSNTRRLCNADGLGYTDTACGASTTCSAGVCAAWTCTPGAYSCADVNSRRVCNADGLGYTSASCAGAATYGYSCTGAGTCTDRACIPGTNGPVCASATARQVCTSDGLGYSTVACAASESCAAGACQTRICTAGAARCVAGTLTGREVCAPDGLSWTATACADTQSCSGAGTCSTRVCTPGAPQCVGTTGTRTCNADGLGYSATTTCTAGTSCSAATGLCGAWLCTPGSTSCVAGTNTRHVCNADGLGYTDTACGASTTCSAGVCAAWTCTPGAFSCADVNTRRVCNADGLGYTSASCAGAATYGYSCTGAGMCTDRACIPGTNGPVCASATARQVCNTDGLGYSATSCSAGQSCGTGTCAVRCGDGIVAAMEGCDDGNVISGDGCSATCALEWCSCLDTSSESITAGIAAADLQLQYGFNGSVADLSGHGHTGVVTGTPRYGAACGSSYADLNDTFYVTATTASGPTTTAARTMTFWIRPAAVRGGVIAHQYLSGDAASSSFGAVWNASGGFTVYGNGTNSLAWTPTGGPLTGWHHVTLVPKEARPPRDLLD